MHDSIYRDSIYRDYINGEDVMMPIASSKIGTNMAKTELQTLENGQERIVRATSMLEHGSPSKMSLDHACLNKTSMHQTSLEQTHRGGEHGRNTMFPMISLNR